MSDRATDVDELHPWDRQPWETPTAFRAFHDYYLAQDPPRSVDEAFRRRKGITKETKKRAPGTWRYWSSCLDSAGHKIPDRLTWIERAAAWDKHLDDLANMAVEREWASKIMGKTEVLGRLGEQGRVNIGIFLTTKETPHFDMRGNPIKDIDGNVLTYQTWDIDLEAVKKYGHLVKSISSTRYGPKIELHDGQAALIHSGRHLKLFTDNIDLTTAGEPIQTEKLNDEQLSDALKRLSEIGMALAGGHSLPPAGEGVGGDDPER